VSSFIGGRVENVHADVGADVKKGTLLAVLHSPDLGIAQAGYLKAAARLHETRLAHKRAKELYEAKAISLAELLRREAEMKTIQAESRESYDRLKLLGVTSHDLDRLEREQTIKAYVPITAPFEGRVIMRNLTRGEVVDAQRTLFTIANLSEVWVVAHVPEKDVELVHKNAPVTFIAAAYPHAFFQGTVTYVGDVLDPPTRTLKVRITAPNPDMRLKPEMFALVRFTADIGAEVLTVPLNSIQNGPDGKVVFVQRAQGQYEIRPVQLGDEQGDLVIVLDGLRRGELVVTKGSFVLKSEMERHRIEPAP
jgi:cobalt-zinc-cadmium efflux system membrane fusion protein